MVLDMSTPIVFAILGAWFALAAAVGVAGVWLVIDARRSRGEARCRRCAGLTRYAIR
jgi:hypothetical protein